MWYVYLRNAEGKQKYTEEEKLSCLSCVPYISEAIWWNSASFYEECVEKYNVEEKSQLSHEQAVGENKRGMWRGKTKAAKLA